MILQLSVSLGRGRTQHFQTQDWVEQWHPVVESGVLVSPDPLQIPLVPANTLHIALQVSAHVLPATGCSLPDKTAGSISRCRAPFLESRKEPRGQGRPQNWQREEFCRTAHAGRRLGDVPSEDLRGATRSPQDAFPTCQLFLA